MAYVNDVHICDRCDQVSDDGLTPVVIEAAEAADRFYPGSPRVEEDWCPTCVLTKQYVAIVRDDWDEEASPYWD